MIYRYLHKRNHLCSKNKLILRINGHKQLAQKRETEKCLGDGSYLLQKSQIYSSKKTTRGRGFWPKSNKCLLAKLWRRLPSKSYRSLFCATVP